MSWRPVEDLPAAEPSPLDLYEQAETERHFRRVVAESGPSARAVFEAVTSADEGPRPSVRALARQLGLSRYRVSAALRLLFEPGETERRVAWTPRERARRWYAGLSPERRRERYARQRSRLLQRRAQAAQA